MSRPKGTPNRVRRPRTVRHSTNYTEPELATLASIDKNVSAAVKFLILQYRCRAIAADEVLPNT